MMREMEWIRWFIGHCCVCKLGSSLAGEMHVSWAMVVVRVRWEAGGFVRKLSDSC
jgi:hypothetical protein